jgi:hypothetical protein
LYQEALKKRLSTSIVGPGSYDTSKNILRDAADAENQFVSIQKKPAPAFNSGAAARMDDRKMADHKRALTTTEGDPNENSNKPIYELQLLEGPQMKANRLFETIENSDASRSRQQLHMGSVHKQNHLQRLTD